MLAEVGAVPKETLLVPEELVAEVLDQLTTPPLRQVLPTPEAAAVVVVLPVTPVPQAALAALVLS